MFRLSFFFQSHKKVSQKLNAKFRNWHKRWRDEHLIEGQEKQCDDWLMGKIDGLVPNITRCSNDNDLNKAPYSPYNRYKAEITSVTNASTS